MNAARAALLALNLPVAIFCAMATFAGLFGLGAPEPNPWRWLFIASPLLLALWLSGAAVLRAQMPIVALILIAIPPLALCALLILALCFAR